MKQMIFYSMTEAETFDPSISIRSLADIREKGFDSIYLEFRNTKAPRNAPRFRAALARITEECSRIGLEVMMDAHLGASHATDILINHPEIYTDSLSYRRVNITEGTFEIEIGYSDPSVLSIENAWLLNDDDTVSEIRDACTLLSQTSEGGGCAMTAASGVAVTRQIWKVEGVTTGEAFLVTRERFRYENRDLGHPAHIPYLDSLCDYTAECKTAGIFWDEPHYGFDFMKDSYPINERMIAVFKDRFGYDLVPRLIDLWMDIPGRDSAQVRLDFAEMLETGLSDLECAFKERILEHPKLGGANPDYFVGMHRTMHEELSDDFWIGSVDYFRHNRGLTAACTDSVFEREDSMLTFNLLARSMASLTKSGEAWSNSWGFNPTNTHLQYYLRLMGCMGVRWIGHTYHGSAMFGPGFPHHPTWDCMAENLSIHRELLEQINGATPLSDTAILYHWRGLADFPDNYLQQHRRSFMLSCLELLDGQSQVTVIDPAQLSDKRFKRLLVLWPSRLPNEAWDALDAQAAAGTEILLLGPPARYNDRGEDISHRWEGLTGSVLPKSEDEFPLTYGVDIDIDGKTIPLDPGVAVPNWRSNPENTYPDHVKAWTLTGAEPVVSVDGKTVGVRQGNVTTVAMELPQCVGALSQLWPMAPSIPDGFLAFAYERNGEELLALCSRRAEPISATFQWKGKTITCTACRHGVLRRSADGSVSAWGPGIKTT